MKKLLTSSLLIGLLLPGLASAANNDVSLTTDTDLSVNSITLDVSGSTAAVESIKVDSTNFTVVLQGSSYFKVSAPSFNQLGYDVLDTANQPSSVDYVCNGSAATLEVSAIASTTVIVTPSSSLCADAVESSSSGSGKGSGGGGGTPAPQASPVAQVVTNTDFSSLTPAEKQAMITQIRTTLASLIQQLITQLIAELQAQIQVQTSSN